MEAQGLMFVLISYDVVDRRTEVFRSLLSRYLTHEQNSVFAGMIGEADLRTLKAEMSRCAVPDDRFLLVLARNRNNIDITRLEKSDSNHLLTEAKGTDLTEKSHVL